MTTKPSNLTRTWAAGAPGGNVVDPDTTTPGKFDDGCLAEIPPFEHFNFLQQLFTQALANLNEQGMFVYDAVTDYPVEGMAKGSDGAIYTVLIANGPASSVVDPVGDATGTWFKIIALEELKATILTHDMASDADYALATAENYKGSIVITDTSVNLTTARNIIVSDIERTFFAKNETLEDLTFKTSAGTGITLTPDETKQLITDGTNVEALTVEASATEKGVIELATDAEVQAGTDAVRAVTPLSLASLGKSHATSGYQKLPGGMIIQWGSESVNGSTKDTVSLPITFPNNIFNAQATDGGSDTGYFTASALTTTSIDLENSSGTASQVFWTAIGN